MSESIKKIALLGNPNAGKSSLFNQLTGLRQKVGNFPGVTVERKSGFIKLADKIEVEIIDLPGTYSLYPTSLDERIAVNALIDIQ
jgi:ferrous iron transport protein B